MVSIGQLLCSIKILSCFSTTTTNLLSLRDNVYYLFICYPLVDTGLAAASIRIYGACPVRDNGLVAASIKIYGACPIRDNGLVAASIRIYGACPVGTAGW
jgi:hypothetical protein